MKMIVQQFQRGGGARVERAVEVKRIRLTVEGYWDGDCWIYNDAGVCIGYYDSLMLDTEADTTGALKVEELPEERP